MHEILVILIEDNFKCSHISNWNLMSIMSHSLDNIFITVASAFDYKIKNVYIVAATMDSAFLSLLKRKLRAWIMLPIVW